MNQYTELLYYIKQLAEADVLVNTVARGPMDSIDLEKQNLYPLVHLDITAGAFSNGQTVLFDVEIACLDIRDINKEIIEADKFWPNDNEVDNHNATHAILNGIWSKMFRDFEANNITASEDPTLEKITFGEGNLLDGWLLSFTVEMPNDTINLCL